MNDQYITFNIQIAMKYPNEDLKECLHIRYEDYLVHKQFWKKQELLDFDEMGQL